MIERQSSFFLTDVRQQMDSGSAGRSVRLLHGARVPQSGFLPAVAVHSVRHTAASVPGIRWIYMTVRADDRVPRWWVERLGAHYCESYFYRRVLWREEKWRSAEATAEG
jgi:hypothetical protein